MSSVRRVVFENTGCGWGWQRPRERAAESPYDDENLVTALVPSDTACLESSPGRMRRTAVWTSRDESVALPEKRQSLAASPAMPVRGVFLDARRGRRNK